MNWFDNNTDAVKKFISSALIGDKPELSYSAGFIGKDVTDLDEDKKLKEQYENDHKLVIIIQFRNEWANRKWILEYH